MQAQTASSLQDSDVQLNQVKKQLEAQSDLARRLEEDLQLLQKSRDSDSAGNKPQTDAVSLATNPLVLFYNLLTFRFTLGFFGGIGG